MGQKASIRDVAAEAGVSVTTVSHVLNNKSGTRVSPETRERVETAARRLGYAANGLARGLRLQRSQTLGLLGDEIATTPYAGRMILGAQETASARGWLLMLLTTGRDPEVERREIQALARHRVDGVLYATMYHRVVRVPDELRPMPVVLLDAADADGAYPSVVPDERGGGQAAVRELLAHGHRRIGFVTNVDDIPATHGRLDGYRDALREAGVPFRPELVLAEVSDTHGGHRAARALLDRPDRPTALFCFNDRMAMGAYRAAGELGLRVPADLSVVGFDNQELIAEGLHPGLSTVALPHYEMGAWAVTTMVELLDQPKGARRRAASQVVMPCPLIRRQSVAAAPH
ncbi:LacI family DNA-binding transcriptional regulator [Micromonospora sp. WMMC241]|uniref:LacI family DNA-binding transcriptional regulator n=1 Tax=Micromonospora sp. WMMC241 TaxID=3015159 RepID=UPI0022B6B861|nr:LacI family DNA-binding transcriptional regulator [Micromonospora sp. WMMC241]MCZ7436812.1 LacI family DNA-binding transcriptional regulator [Micromonospora sp. WMMC241]